MNNSNYHFDLKDFPTTRYQGSKRKILDWLYEKFNTLDFETVLDGFGGTASVSYLLKKMGKEVTYNDKYKFNFLLGKAIVENDRFILDEGDIHYLITKNNFNKYYSTIQDNFSSIYYLDEENRWLDKIISNIIQFENYVNDEGTIYKKALAFYAVFQACLMKRPFNLFHRKNLYLRTNDVKRSFGNKTTWERPFENLFKKFIKEANALIVDTNKKCKAINESIFELNQNEYDLVYLDPPYITNKSKNETSDYLRCYHFLEGLSMYSEWENLMDFDTPNRRFKKTIESNDFTPSVAPELLSDIIKKFKKSTIVLSYKKGGIPSIEYLEEILNKHKSNVEIFSQHYVYALNNQNGDANKNREVLLIGY
jgi:adenine-specific DNA-methyltransferase